ncbi:conserved hypothetical protein 245 [Methanococcus vannielii SB]|uniref:Iron export ABC transporter permease subunit FetB n=1 Tax=Methanococcus vannielii (strain ATCC 35089 / DSM 1224 / JCM 13029 / OCM 148 / SB) TaxID=406327 RepID=A6URF2_METVS|nr:conserved hypothetical protein 245 [Methanococcus vannielii SB]
MLLSLLIIFKEKLGFSKEIFIAEILALLQLVILGYIIGIIFSLNLTYTFLLITVMIIIASFMVEGNVTKSKDKKIILSSFFAIFISTAVSTMILVFSGTIIFESQYLIPLLGMVIGNSTNAVSIALERFLNDLKAEKDVLWGYLALGATERQSVSPYIKKSVKASITPHLNSTRAVGLIFIPGAMVGLLIAGIDPIEAAKIQVTIMWMIMFSSIFSSTLSCCLLYRNFIHKTSN